jgi:hypothetical protein
MKTILHVIVLLTLAWAAILANAEQPFSIAAWRQQLEADWLLQARMDANPQGATLTTELDAAGGCDGIKDGGYGFHTGSTQNPWWEVQLGAREVISKIVIWNREDSPKRASHFSVRLSDGHDARIVYRHDGAAFGGVSDQKPLVIHLSNEVARIVRIQMSGKEYLHLDEVEVFGPDDPSRNLALHKPANQSSLSEWSQPHSKLAPVDWIAQTRETLANCKRLSVESGEPGRTLTEQERFTFEQIEQQLASLPSEESAEKLFLEARALQRKLALANPLMDFDALLFTKHVPPSFNHMSDQYYGWWSRPGGGIYILRNFRNGTPTITCLTDSFKEPGTFLRPTLSYDGDKILFAWCRYYPHLAAETNKLNKANVPEDAFYHLFEMNVDGSGVRQLSHGKYDDFDGRYLPDGRIIFLSTRRGQSLQVGRESAARTVAKADLPDCYVRCGGGPERPVAVYTLHVMNANGAQLNAISPFEMFEWTPEISHDGSILFSRWDYIDRDNMPYMGLWAMSPDGLNPRVIYGNYTKAPHCVFEPKPIPGSHKIIFTASGHHSQTMGSLVLLDPSVGTEGSAPLRRLTPEVPFPEIESWPKTYYASPWPLSERRHLVAWGAEGETVPGPKGWNRWHSVRRAPNGMALYYFDADGGRELLYRDAELTCGDPIPLRARTRPPIVAKVIGPAPANEGRFLLTDVYRGLNTVKRGEIRELRIIAVPPKTHPTMNFPEMGLTRDDPGKCVLGTVPVESDGSAYFRAPAGVILFFQALNERGVALQTMKSVTHLQPGQTLSCAGCHDDRNTAPESQSLTAILRPPSKIKVGPPGSWPLRFDELIQPVLDRKCVECHRSDSQNVEAAKVDLTAPKAYLALANFGKPNLREQVHAGYARGYSIENEGIAARSELLALLTNPKGHHDINLSSDDLERLIVWMDAYAQRIGAFSIEQENELKAFRKDCADLLIEPQTAEAGSEMRRAAASRVIP